MTSNLQMATAVVAPIDIQPSLSIQCPKILSSSPSSRLDLGESPADSGYESSWPSLSEAATWSPPPGQKRQLNIFKPSSGTNGSLSSPEHTPLNPYFKETTQLSNPQHYNRPCQQQNNRNQKGTKKASKAQQPQPQQQQQNLHLQKQNQSQNANNNKKSQKQTNGQKKKQKQQQQQGKRAVHQHQYTMPLVDICSPQLDDHDQYYGPVGPPIPLSVIPRGWLYEEEYAPPIDDDILIALPKREWVYDTENPLSMDTKSFVVMSWNILSPRLCHASRLDAECDPTFLDWNYRKETILNQIAFTDADIICLQELELKDYEEYFNPHLSRLGFKSIRAYKMNVYEMRDGCVIFYRDSRFKLLNEHVLRFNQVELDEDNVTRPSMARDTAIRFNLFHNIALIALFENKRTKRHVQIATTHLLADPAFPDAKMLQTAILTSKLEELKAEAIAAMTSSDTSLQNQSHPQQHIPSILAGDFNSLPDSPVVDFLKNGQVDTCQFGDNDFGRFTRADNKHFYHSLGLVDSYKSSILPFTNATRKFQGTIDYLLHDPSSLSLVGFLDHLEPEPEPESLLPESAPLRKLSAKSETGMSSSDLDSELDVDIPSSVKSSPSLTQSKVTMKNSNKKNKRPKKAIQQKLDFASLWSSLSLDSSPTPTNAMEDKQVPTIQRASIPTALPSQYFPSDHIPLVAIFREREHIPAA